MQIGFSVNEVLCLLSLASGGSGDGIIGFEGHGAAGERQTTTRLLDGELPTLLAQPDDLRPLDEVGRLASGLSEAGTALWLRDGVAQSEGEPVAE